VALCTSPQFFQEEEVVVAIIKAQLLNRQATLNLPLILKLCTIKNRNLYMLGVVLVVSPLLEVILLLILLNRWLINLLLKVRRFLNRGLFRK
jgi:hypothetical protein